MMKGILSFPSISSLPVRPFGAETGRILLYVALVVPCPAVQWLLEIWHNQGYKVLECLYWLVQYHEKGILFYWIPSHVGTRGNEEGRKELGFTSLSTA